MTDKEKLAAFAEDMAQLMGRHPEVHIEWESDRESDYAFLVCGDEKDYLGGPLCLPDSEAQWRELSRNLRMKREHQA